MKTLEYVVMQNVFFQNHIMLLARLFRFPTVKHRACIVLAILHCLIQYHCGSCDSASWRTCSQYNANRNISPSASSCVLRPDVQRYTDRMTNQLSPMTAKNEITNSLVAEWANPHSHAAKSSRKPSQRNGRHYKSKGGNKSGLSVLKSTYGSDT